MSSSVVTKNSTTLRKVDYNQTERSLDIEFRTGNVYRYYTVPPQIWKAFQICIENAGSAGQFFNEYIKDQFEFEKLKDVPN